MKVTAKEAGTKRCQEGFAAANGLSIDGGIGAFVATSGGPQYGAAGSWGTAIAQGGAPIYCIAGQCMAWQWTNEETDDGDPLGFCGKCRTRTDGL